MDDLERFAADRKRLRRGSAALGAVAVLAVGAVGALLNRPLPVTGIEVELGPTAEPTEPPAIATPDPQQATPATPTPEPEPEARDETPSQSPEDAARDGVVPAVAALPFDIRLKEYSHGVSRLVTDEGVWLVSRLGEEAWYHHDQGRSGEIQDSLGAIDDVGALYGRDVVSISEYGEVLLHDPTETGILRAFPMPGLPPHVLAVTDDAVFCARQGTAHCLNPCSVASTVSPMTGSCECSRGSRARTTGPSRSPIRTFQATGSWTTRSTTGSRISSPSADG